MIVKGWSYKKPLEVQVNFYMDRTEELLDLLNTLILSFVDNTITANIASLIDVLTFLQYS
jgi:hypothetical protein